MSAEKNAWAEQWRVLWKGQMEEGLELRRRVWKLEADLTLYEDATARTRRDLDLARKEYGLSADLSREMFDHFKADWTNQAERTSEET